MTLLISAQIPSTDIYSYRTWKEKRHEDTEKRKKQDKLETVIDALRRKTGDKAVTRGFQKNEDIGIK